MGECGRDQGRGIVAVRSTDPGMYFGQLTRVRPDAESPAPKSEILSDFGANARNQGKHSYPENAVVSPERRERAAALKHVWKST